MIPMGDETALAGEASGIVGDDMEEEEKGLAIGEQEEMDINAVYIGSCASTDDEARSCLNLAAHASHVPCLCPAVAPEPDNRRRVSLL